MRTVKRDYSGAVGKAPHSPSAFRTTTGPNWDRRNCATLPRPSGKSPPANSLRLFSAIKSPMPWPQARAPAPCPCPAESTGFKPPTSLHPAAPQRALAILDQFPSDICRGPMGPLEAAIARAGPRTRPIPIRQFHLLPRRQNVTTNTPHLYTLISIPCYLNQRNGRFFSSSPLPP